MNKSRSKSKKNFTRRGAAAIGAGVLLLLVLIFLADHSRPQETVETTQPETALSPSVYGPEDFVYDGQYLTCAAGSAVLGVDVSSHQQEVDWAQVKEAGMEFAMIRIGYRGYTQGGLNADEFADENLRGASAAGLQVGAYFYSQAISVEEALEEAEFCIELLQGHDLDLPVVFDWEYVSADARTGDMDSQTLTACAQAFCQRIEDAGYDAMVYFNPHIAQEYLNLEELSAYPFWLALYSDSMTYPYQVEMWQYTQNGNVPGISGDADINLWFTD